MAFNTFRFSFGEHTKQARTEHPVSFQKCSPADQFRFPSLRHQQTSHKNSQSVYTACWYPNFEVRECPASGQSYNFYT